MSLDVTTRVSAAVATMLSTRDNWAWLSPAEPSALLEQFFDAQPLLALPQGSNPATKPVAVQVDQNSAKLVNDDVIILKSLTSPTQSTILPPARYPVAGRAIYSAIDDAVYLFGGNDFPGTIAMVDVTTQQVRYLPVPEDRAPAAEVLAAAYDQPRHMFYYLNLVQRHQKKPWPAIKHAQLIAFNVADASAKVLVDVPYLKLFSSLHLSVGEDGHPILVASGARHHFAWRINPAGQKPLFEGLHVGNGEAVQSPIPGRIAPILPVSDRNAISFVNLDRGAFWPGAECKGL